MVWGRFKGPGRPIAPLCPPLGLVARLSTCIWSSTRVLVVVSHLGHTSMPFTTPTVPLRHGSCQILGAIKLGPGQLLYPYIRKGKMGAYVCNSGDTDDVAYAMFAFMDTLSPQTFKCNWSILTTENFLPPPGCPEGAVKAGSFRPIRGVWGPGST
jgi:hypothetical protein